MTGIERVQGHIASFDPAVEGVRKGQYQRSKSKLFSTWAARLASERGDLSTAVTTSERRPLPVSIPVSYRSCIRVEHRRSVDSHVENTTIWNRYYSHSIREKVKDYVKSLDRTDTDIVTINRSLQQCQNDQVKEYFRVAPELMVEFLGKVRLDQSWLNQFLSKLDNPPEEKAMACLIAAHQNRVYPSMALTHLQGAVLSGWSHPLPYLQLMDHHVTCVEYDKATHIKEMYRVCVAQNQTWESFSSETSEIQEWHSNERARLHSLFKESLKQIDAFKENSMRKAPENEKLQSAINYWPKEHQEVVEILLYDGALKCTFWIEHAYRFITAVIDKNIEKWDREECLQQKSEQLVLYVNALFGLITSRNNLMEKSCEMLFRRGELDTAIQRMYSYTRGSVTPEKLNLRLYAASLELVRHGISVTPYSYEEAKRFVDIALANGNKENLDLALQNIRSVSADILNQYGSLLIDEKKRQLTGLWNNLPFLQCYSPTGSLSGSLPLPLLAGLQEARRQGFYEGKLPDIQFLRAFYRTLDKIPGCHAQLFVIAKGINNPLALSAIYNSALGLIDKDHAHVHNGQALTLLLACQWLEWL